MKNILITGANGFSGSHLLEDFVENLPDEYAIVAACRDQAKLPEWYMGNVMEGDLHDPAYLNEITKNADVICHTASWAEMNGSLQNSNKNFYDPTVNLINASLKNNVQRFVFLSSVTSNVIDQKRVHSKQRLDKIWPHYYNVIRIEDYLRKISEAGKMEVVVLRLGFFVGKNYSLGLLPILLPRLKAHLVPWVEKGETTLPLIDGLDIGQAFRLASTQKLEAKYTAIDIVGKEVPTVKGIFQYLKTKHNYPLPHFSVSFGFAHLFARIVRFTYKFVPGDPLIVPAIVLLLEETNASNSNASKVLGFSPRVDWRKSVDIQIEEMERRQTSNFKMNK